MSENIKSYRLYVIYPRDEDLTTKTICYIGCTSKKVNRRFIEHKSKFKAGKNQYSSFKLFKKFGAENLRIKQLTPYEFKSSLASHVMEGLFMDLYKNCINERKSGRSRQEYYKDNFEIIKEKKKIYYNKVKDALLLKNKIKEECPICKSMFRSNEKKRHEKTKKHIKNQLISNSIYNDYSNEF